jgi:anti-anti-sigma factor
MMVFGRGSGSKEAAFNVAVIDVAGGQEMLLVGEMDVAAAPVVRERLRDAIEQGPGNVIIDMRSVAFLDSSVLGVLVAARKRAFLNGVQIILRSPSESVRQVLALTALGSFFDIE